VNPSTAGTVPPRIDGPIPGLLLAFVGGYVDTFSFVVLFALFTAHVTGNFVLIGAALAGHGHGGIIAKLLALPMFIFAVAATHGLYRWRERRGLESARTLVAIQLAMLLAFMAIGLVSGPFQEADAPWAVLTGLVGVATMAIQNAAARSAFAQLSPTTVMTGNVTQATMDIVDFLQPGSPRDAAVARVAKLVPPIVAFAFGAVGAGLLSARFGFACLLLPAGALLLLLRRA